jgi:hypothetical protein
LTATSTRVAVAPPRSKRRACASSWSRGMLSSPEVRASGSSLVASHSEDRSLSSVVRRALSEHVDRERSVQA